MSIDRFPSKFPFPEKPEYLTPNQEIKRATYEHSCYNCRNKFTTDSMDARCNQCGKITYGQEIESETEQNG